MTTGAACWSDSVVATAAAESGRWVGYGDDRGPVVPVIGWALVAATKPRPGALITVQPLVVCCGGVSPAGIHAAMHPPGQQVWRVWREVGP